MVDYTINDVFDMLKHIKSNPYAVKDSKHMFKRCNQREIDVGEVISKIYQDIPVGIEKAYNTNSKFQLIYEYNKSEDLYVVINIDNSESITIITCIRKTINRREHD